MDRGDNPSEAARVAGLAGVRRHRRSRRHRLVTRPASTQRAFSPACVWPWRRRSCSSIYAHGKILDAFAALLLGCVLGAEVDFTAFLVRRYFWQRCLQPPIWRRLRSVRSPAVGIGPLVLGMSYDHMGGYNPHGLLLFVALSYCGWPLATFAMPHIAKPAPELERVVQ